MYSPLKLYTAAIMLLCIVANGKFPDTTILSGPVCIGKSTTKAYDHNVKRLIDGFVKNTKTSRRNILGDRQMNHSYPNRNPGSPFGMSTCYQDLGRLDCFNCLFNAKGKLHSGCLHPIAASIKLQDCSITFNITV
ncbi:hypothetical protein LINGRAHAP2_LOCUS17605 [Linum grandiflorum]